MSEIAERKIDLEEEDGVEAAEGYRFSMRSRLFAMQVVLLSLIVLTANVGILRASSLHEAPAENPPITNESEGGDTITVQNQTGEPTEEPIQEPPAEPVGEPPAVIITSSVAITPQEAMLSPLWEIRYENTPDESLFSIAEGPLESFLLVGRTREYGENQQLISRLWVVKVGADGMVSWERYYDGSRLEMPHDVTAATDGGYVIAGSASQPAEEGGRTQFCLMRIDEQGDVLWEKAWGENQRSEATCVLPSGCGYVVGGYTGASASASQDLWVGELNGSGTLLWNRTYGGSMHDSAQCIAPDGQGGCVLAGISDSMGSSRRIYLVRIDEAGDALWEKRCGDSSWNEAQDVVETQDEGFIVVGKSSNGTVSDGYLLKIDDAGEKVWERFYTGKVNTGFKGVVSLPTGDYVAVGYTYTERDGPAEVYVVRFDSDGNTSRQTTLPNRMAALSIAHDGRLLISTEVDTEERYRDVVLQKLEIAGG